MITLINPPAPWANEPAMGEPLGLCYVAAALAAEGFPVNAVDFCALKHDYTKRDYLYDIPMFASVYGIYCMSVQLKWVKQIIEHLKNCNSQAKVFVGGPHATCVPEDLYKAGADYVVQGYGDWAIVNYLLKSENHYSPNPLIPNRLPFEKYTYNRTIHGNPAKHIVTLRGCPYSCHYCDKKSVGRHVEYVGIPTVASEISLLNKRYNTNSFVIYDDIFTLDKNRLSEFCKIFKKGDIKWRCWARTDLVDHDTLSLMKDSGLQSITFGVESGDDSVLRRINKKATVEYNWGALDFCKNLKIPVRCSLMFGNPGENKKSLYNTIRMISMCQPDEWNLAVLKPMPGSEFWENPHYYGLQFDKQAIIDSDYQLLNRFEDNGVGNVVAGLDTCSKEELEELLPWFVSELERVSPRKKIQDSIQEIKLL
jgi:radical SAM superfamily enzyme YgiQ (UPF0313 family)